MDTSHRVSSMSQFKTALTAYQGFTDLVQSVILSTVSEDSIPNASYAPFVIDESKNIYIYVNGLSIHTQNLSNVPRASVLFIEDESHTQQIFARRRLTFDCIAQYIERDTELWNRIVKRFEARFGEIIQIFRDLPDFRIVQLAPSQGRFVMSFGATYEVDPNNLDTLIDITGEGK